MKPPSKRVAAPQRAYALMSHTVKTHFQMAYCYFGLMIPFYKVFLHYNNAQTSDPLMGFNQTQTTPSAKQRTALFCYNT
jgi:hypothetical protein